jgi:hypothetical protein
VAFQGTPVRATEPLVREGSVASAIPFIKIKYSAATACSPNMPSTLNLGVQSITELLSSIKAAWGASATATPNTEGRLISLQQSRHS